MREGKPSTTALRVAMRRAAHQLFDSPLVLDDPIALPILGAEIAARVEAGRGDARKAASRYVRAFMVARSRFAEDELARAVSRGAAQYLILGAGLDTFAYRNPYPQSKLIVFEVDHPVTQIWKLQRLGAGGIAVPPSLTFAPVDFERQSLAAGLDAVGFRRDAITFFSWLGVTPYLTSEAMNATLGFIASMPRGSGVVFDYAVPRSSLNWAGRLIFDRLAKRVAAAGEPFQLFFDPADLAAQLRAVGFHAVEDLGSDEINARYFAGRQDKLCVSGRLGRVLSATV
ncbi:MAG TPA: class I SAM-dependent methyltransferase [Candidatus Limnocylindrales bacterium]|nr:class I SAM-dependent methyltransferase [Candidatus Limnocylindrales bacterium]